MSSTIPQEIIDKILLYLKSNVPQELIDKIFLYLNTEDILELGEKNVSEYVWLCKKDKNLIEACRNKNMVGIHYHIEQGANIHEYGMQH
jgi:hypothetical protein